MVGDVGKSYERARDLVDDIDSTRYFSDDQRIALAQVYATLAVAEVLDGRRDLHDAERKK